jgi:3-isopropylmalate/(R)-2-methylmalate dehydratase small subunit
MISGRVWIFGGDINTDMILPTAIMYRPAEEQARHVFSAARPGWADKVEKGDIIVAGRNFGTGSARPAPLALTALGIACVVADSFNRLFFRNCVSFGLPAVECEGASAAFSEGDIAQVRLDGSEVRNARTRAALHGTRIPDDLLKLMSSGGVFPLLESEGLIGGLKAGQPQTDE